MGHGEAIHTDQEIALGQRALSRELLLSRLARHSNEARLPSACQSLTEYCGASRYLLARYDLVSEQGLDSIISSNWPFDIVRWVDAELQALYHRTNEMEKCLMILQPSFALLPEEVFVPEGVSSQYCSILFNAGRTRYIFMVLIPEHIVLSNQRMMEAGLLASYVISMQTEKEVLAERDMDLTERELECLYWIAEGKTSDEIAVILGISRNTINNYITSVMRKTSTKNRSEAIAYAVRNNLV